VDRRDDSFRFFCGAAPRKSPRSTLRTGLDIIREVGVPRIREKSIPQTARLIAGAKARLAREHPGRSG